MSITERDVVLREREAYAMGRVGYSIHNYHPSTIACAECARSRRAAAEQFPLPKIQSLRIEPDPHGEDAEYRVRIRSVPHIEWREALSHASRRWRDWPEGNEDGLFATGPRADLWSDMLKNPFRLVEDDGAAIEGKAND